MLRHKPQMFGNNSERNVISGYGQMAYMPDSLIYHGVLAVAVTQESTRSLVFAALLCKRTIGPGLALSHSKYKASACRSDSCGEDCGSLQRWCAQSHLLFTHMFTGPQTKDGHVWLYTHTHTDHSYSVAPFV